MLHGTQVGHTLNGLPHSFEQCFVGSWGFGCRSSHIDSAFCRHFAAKLFGTVRHSWVPSNTKLGPSGKEQVTRRYLRTRSGITGVGLQNPGPVIHIPSLRHERSVPQLPIRQHPNRQHPNHRLLFRGEFDPPPSPPQTRSLQEPPIMAVGFFFYQKHITPLTEASTCAAAPGGLAPPGHPNREPRVLAEASLRCLR